MPTFEGWTGLVIRSTTCGGQFRIGFRNVQRCSRGDGVVVTRMPRRRVHDDDKGRRSGRGVRQAECGRSTLEEAEGLDSGVARVSWVSLSLDRVLLSGVVVWRRQLLLA